MSTCWILHGVKFVNNDIDCALFREVQRFIISMATVSRLFHGWQRTRLTSAQLEILDSLRGFSQGQNCWRKIAVILSFSSAKKSHWGKISSFVVLDVCSLPVRARRCRTVSSFVHWKLVSHGLRQQCCLSSWGLLQILNYFICLSKSGVSCNGKWFFERRQADVQKLFRKIFSSSFDICFTGFQFLVPPGLARHSVSLTLRYKLLLSSNLNECVKLPRSWLKFWELKGRHTRWDKSLRLVPATSRRD